MSHLKAHDELLDRLIVARKSPQIFIIIRIWQKPHVKHQVCVAWNPVFESKGKHRDHQILEFPVLDKDLVQFLLQFPHKKLTCINNVIRMLLQKDQTIPLQDNPLLDPPGFRQGMHPPGLLIALHQDIIAGIQKKDLTGNPSGLHMREDLLHLSQRPAASDIQPDGHLRDLAVAGSRQLRKLVHKRYRQVIHTEITRILQYLQRRRLTCTGHAGHNYQSHLFCLPPEFTSAYFSVCSHPRNFTSV